jgi:hypothetical protein
VTQSLADASSVNHPSFRRYYMDLRFFMFQDQLRKEKLVSKPCFMVTLMHKLKRLYGLLVK